MRLSPSLTSDIVISSLLAGPATAGDREDWSAGQPEDCSRIIEQVSQPADKVAAAYRHQCCAGLATPTWKQHQGDCNEEPV